MEVILLERVEKLGKMGDIVDVKPGYARNYLLPQKRALRATKENRALFERQRADLETANLRRREEAKEVAKRTGGLTVVLLRQAGEGGQLYGSVSARDIAAGLGEAGFPVDRRQVLLDRAVKTVGLFPVRVALHPEVLVEVTVNVARSPEEAEAQAKGEALAAPEAADEPRAVGAAEATGPTMKVGKAGVGSAPPEPAPEPPPAKG